jgi:hypothetical protein
MPAAMQVLKWTQPRLQRLFRYYNTRYWGGELPEFRVVNRRLKKGIAGWYDYKHKTIWIDLRPEKIPADRYVKQVVLHECCHVATRQSRGPHGARFFHEVLRLIGLGSRWAARDWLEFDDNGSPADIRTIKSFPRRYLKTVPSPMPRRFSPFRRR